MIRAAHERADHSDGESSSEYIDMARHASDNVFTVPHNIQTADTAHQRYTEYLTTLRCLAESVMQEGSYAGVSSISMNNDGDMPQIFVDVLPKYTDDVQKVMDRIRGPIRINVKGLTHGEEAVIETLETEHQRIQREERLIRETMQKIVPWVFYSVERNGKVVLKAQGDFLDCLDPVVQELIDNDVLVDVRALTKSEYDYLAKRPGKVPEKLSI